MKSRNVSCFPLAVHEKETTPLQTTAAKEGREFMDCFWGSATKGFQSSVLRRMCGLCKRLKEESSVSSRLCAHRDLEDIGKWRAPEQQA